MWETLFKLCRIDRPDPVQAWKDHILGLKARSGYLNKKNYSAFHYRAPGTDITIGLPEGHEWHAAQSNTTMGFPFTANIPTEEVYTLPHKNRADGVVSASMPLNYNGMLIDGIVLEFKEGRVIKASARVGEAVLQKLVATDEGAARLGEVAIVPYSSPISQSGLIFYNTLFDENAACHLALGNAYDTTIKNGTSMTPDQFAEAGGNSSIIHVDFMIGSNKMDIDGISSDGSKEPVLRSGEWAFSV
jgi:aminopeptidase